MLSEIENYGNRIESLHALIRDAIEGLPEEALNWRPVQGEGDHATNSLAVLVAHIAGAEYHWITEVIGQRPATRVREAEFETQAGSAAELWAILERAAASTNEVLAGLSAAELDQPRQVDDHKVIVRWALLHVVDHTALHLGHIQITRQLWDGGKARPSPFWQHRLPDASGK